MANALVTIAKDVEVGAEDLLKFVTGGASLVSKAGPNVIAGLGVLATGIEKALTDTANAAANPLDALINAPAELADFEAVWPDVKAFLADLGIKV